METRSAARGVISAGSTVTAEAGAQILRSGGNAIDAAVAACFATSAGEPSLTSLAGGGILLYYDAKTERTTVCDFFSHTPGLGLSQDQHSDFDARDFFSVQLSFGPATQDFYIGRGAAGVPGTLPGLCGAHERWGKLPLAQIVAPTCHALRQGVVLDGYQQRTLKLLEPILLHTPQGRALYSENGRIKGLGDTFSCPLLADVLEDLADRGWDDFYRNFLIPRILSAFSPAQGGLLTERDLLEFKVAFRDALSFRFRDCIAQTNPPPAAGGTLIGVMLDMIAQIPQEEMRRGEPNIGAAGHLARAMKISDETRVVAQHALEPEALKHWRDRYQELRKIPLGNSPHSNGGHTSTTHISVIDAEGNAAGVTLSHGEGNGHLIPETGIMMNNFMGEEDLHPGGFGPLPPGQRLPTMMSPTLLRQGKRLVVLGSGGANRIRTAITQVMVRLIDFDDTAQNAVSAPRIHFEHGVLNAELFERNDGGKALVDLAPDSFVPFEQPHLFFGGVHIAQRLADGTLEGAGDPRRSGTVVVARKN